MSKLVSQDELDVLLSTDDLRKQSPSYAIPYDFRRPDRITKEQLRSLHFLHDRFAHNVSSSLSAFLRSMTEVTIISVDQLAYVEFLTSLPDPTAFYALSMHPLELLVALDLNPDLAFSMVDRMLGGTGEGKGPDRPLTEIEQNVIDSVVKLLMDHLSETWRPVAAIQFTIHGRETRPQMLQVTAPNDIVVLVTFVVKIGETRGTLKFCIPAAAIEAIGDTFAQAWHRTRRQPTPEEAQRLAANLDKVPLPVSAQLATTMSARELVALRPGDVLSLSRHRAQPVLVHVGEQPTFTGQLVVRNGNLTIRVQGALAEIGDGELS